MTDTLDFSVMPMATKIYRDITAVKNGRKPIEMPAIKDEFLQNIAEFKDELIQSGYDDEFIKAALYPIIALIDETMLKTTVSHLWAAETFQISFFGDNMAGNNFYTKLNESLSSPQIVFPIIEQYLFAMIYGFKGMYQGSRSDEQKSLILSCATVMDENVYSNLAFSPSEQRKRLQVYRNIKFTPLLFVSVALSIISFWWLILFVISRTAI